MTSNDLEPWAVVHISRVNRAEMVGDRPRQPVYGFLSIERTFLTMYNVTM